MDFMDNILTDNSPIPSGFSHEFSLELNGSELLRKNANVAVNIVNSWSCFCWVKALSGHAGGTLFQIKPVTGSTNQLLITYASDGRVDLTIVDTIGASFKIYQYNTLITSDIWSHVGVTWNGTDLKLYYNGSFVAPSTILLDNSITMTGPNRRVAFGGDVDGGTGLLGARIHSASLWDTDLSAGEVSTAHNGGDGSTLDLSFVQGDNLKHWWLCGGPALCEDQITTDNINLLDDDIGIDASDSVSDAP